MIRLL